MASSSSYSSPCAACKFLRRKCMPGCIFAPYFPPEEPQKFANVHKIFGASNVNKLLNELLPHQREDAVNSLAYEAEARVRDPVYGCVGAISYLQRQVQRLQKELDAANADLVRFTACNDVVPMMQPPPAGANFPLSHVLHHPSLGLIANPSLHHLHGRNRSTSSSSVNDYLINNQNGRIHHHAVAAPAGSTTEAAANHNHNNNNNNTGFYRQYSGTSNNNNIHNNYLVPYTIPWADTTTSDHGINEQGGGGNL